jgi:hypothetical protein
LPEFSGFEGFPELTFQDRENGFDDVSLMVFFLIEIQSNPSAVISGDPLSFSVPYGDKRT